MRIWTYEEMVNKVKRDLDLEDERFIGEDEMAGYFNEALAEAESEIMVTNQDYLLTKAYLPVIVGQTDYDLPLNIYANKIRGIMYSNGSIQYAINQFRRKDKFENIAFTQQYGTNTDYYQYLLVNDVPGQATLRFLPTMRDTAVNFPIASIFAPITLWYIRNCIRVPMIGEWCNPELMTSSPVAQASAFTDSILSFSGKTVSYGVGKYGIIAQMNPGSYPGSIAQVTGDVVKFTPGPGSTLPPPLVEGTSYYVIATGTSFGGGLQIKLATTRQNAFAGTAIDITASGTGLYTMEIAATTAIRNKVRIDIPEFATFIMQWVKCRCMEKEGDPRIEGASALLQQQKKQMIDTLTQSIIDDDDILQGDFSSYWELS